MMETKIFNEYDMIFIHIFKNLGFHSYFFIYSYFANDLLWVFSKTFFCYPLFQSSQIQVLAMPPNFMMCWLARILRIL